MSGVQSNSAERRKGGIIVKTKQWQLTPRTVALVFSVYLLLLVRLWYPLSPDAALRFVASALSSYLAGVVAYLTHEKASPLRSEDNRWGKQQVMQESRTPNIVKHLV